MWNLLWVVGLVGLYWAGRQYIVPQEPGALWYSDPYNVDRNGVPGNGMFYTGSVPPGDSPPWRLASENEQAMLERLETTG